MWTLLRTPACWENYRTQIATDAPAGVTVEFGAGPKEYPCLVSSAWIDTQGMPRVLSAYVFKSDARDLLEALQAKHPKEEDKPAGITPELHNSLRWLTANVLVLAKSVISVSILNEERYEEWLLEALELIDTMNTEKRLRLLKEFAGKIGQSIATPRDQ